MEREKIIYYYPICEQRNEQKRPLAAKRSWFQEAALDAQKADEITVQPSAFDVIGCAVPPFYYRKRVWKPQILSETMEKALQRVEGMADTWVHPRIEAMLTEEYARRFVPRKETIRMVSAQIIRQYAASVIGACGEVTVLLGEPADTNRQMQMTRELLLPYLPRINRFLIFYEEIAEMDIWMELGSHLDEYYYEYGLVPQLEPYFVSCNGGTAERHNVLRCGKPRCGGMILDYGGQFRYPKIPPENKAFYMDITSISEKERELGRKTSRIPYMSPLKYLDTMVKNSYDR